MQIKLKQILIAFYLTSAFFSGGVAAATSPTQAAIGINEQLGATIPLDLPFRAEDGSAVILKDLFTKPTILSLVYYECPGVCTPTLSALAKVVRELQLTPGKDYNVITVSFDETETPELAAEKQKNYLQHIGKPFPAESWRFLTGDRAAIQQLTDAVGFAFQRDNKDFIHSVSVIVLSPKGKIARYIYGVGYLPFDLQMALVEASEGRVGPTINRVLRYCFAYDPEGGRYTLRVTQIAAGFVSVSGMGFLLYLILTRPKNRRPKI